jgi:uncharacterized membrane protein
VKKCSAAAMIAACALLSLSSLASAQKATFQYLSNPNGAGWSSYSLSGNGKSMAANYGGDIYRWTASTGFLFLGHGDIFNSSVGISKDGLTIISGRTGQDGFTNPALWKPTTGWVDLGHPAEGCVLDGSWGSGYAVNSNGTAAVGLAWYCPGAEGFKWSPSRGMVGLGHPPDASSRASAISADGNVIVGFYEDPTSGIRRPVRWIGDTTDLFAGDNTVGEAAAASTDGSQIVGQSDDGTGIAKASYFSDQAGLVSMGTLSGSPFDQSMANSVSDNGIAVGWSGDPFAGTQQAFIWNAKQGMRPLRQVLNGLGANIPRNVTLSTALAISADGSTIVGTWVDTTFQSGGFMARLK